jgi:hypothetical protein
MRFLMTTAAAGLMAILGSAATLAADNSPTPSQQAQLPSDDRQTAATVRDLQERLGHDEQLLRQMQSALPISPAATAAEPYCRSNGYDPARGECN